MNWKKLSAFAPMLAVIVLAGCMGKTLAGYTPATYEAKAERTSTGCSAPYRGGSLGLNPPMSKLMWI